MLIVDILRRSWKTFRIFDGTQCLPDPDTDMHS